MNVIPLNGIFENVEQLLSEGKSIELCFLGRSMQPYLRGDGSEIIVASPFLPNELIPGTIVLFRYHGRFICHRIIRRESENLLIQGDGVIKAQEQSTIQDVIGIIRTIIRKDKEPVSTQTKSAQRYWHCWLRLSPIRKYLLFIYKVYCKLL